jgi:hypothetical protein
VTLTLSLGSRVVTSFRPADCPRSAAEAIINGTYVLPYVVGSSSSGEARYQAVFGDYTIVGVTWYCNQGFYFGYPVTILGSFAFCDTSLFYTSVCFASVKFVFGFGSAFGSTAPNLCSITQGDTTAYSGTTPNPERFSTGIADCDDNNAGGSDYYFVSVSVAPVW